MQGTFRMGGIWGTRSGVVIGFHEKNHTDSIHDHDGDADASSRARSRAWSRTCFVPFQGEVVPHFAKFVYRARVSNSGRRCAEKAGGLSVRLLATGLD
jgi:hypothetical protein